MNKYIAFWREYEQNGYLSQWYIAPMRVNGVTYNCCEQYMMAEKARKFGDNETLSAILEEKDPYTQKRLGRSVKNFVKKDWDEVCREIVYQGNLAKFRSNKSLMDKLLETGDATLIEASPVDRIWGVGLAPDSPRLADKSQWRGTNWLGEAIMRVRDTLNGH